MADVIVAQEVLENALQYIIDEDDYYLKLFCDDDYTPDKDMEAGDFTEATGGGYAHKSIDSSEDFTTEFENSPPDIILPEQTFTFTGVLTTNTTVYGWYLVKQTGGAPVAAKLLDTPYTPASGGGTLTFTPRIQAGNGTPE